MRGSRWKLQSGTLHESPAQEVRQPVTRTHIHGGRQSFRGDGPRPRSVGTRRMLRVLTIIEKWQQQSVALPVHESALQGPPPIATNVSHQTKLAIRALKGRCHICSLKLDFVPPSKPEDNGKIDPFTRRLRDEYLDVQKLTMLGNGKVFLKARRHDFNHAHPVISLGNPSP